MHQHACTHCNQDFVCREALTCFRDRVDCRSCFLRVTMLRRALLFLAVGMTVLLFLKKLTF